MKSSIYWIECKQYTVTCTAVAYFGFAYNLHYFHYYKHFSLDIFFFFVFTFFVRDQVKNVPEQIEKYKKKKYYLHATELLVSTGVIKTTHYSV